MSFLVVAIVATTAAQAETISLQSQPGLLAQTRLGMDFVPVEDPGNEPDTEYRTLGAVADTYYIGKYEVTNSQYTAFLNSVADVEDTYGLYSSLMKTTDAGGIDRFGIAGDYTYVTKSGRGNWPVNYVSWYDALRFINWMNNGQPMGMQDAATTENGAYDMSSGANPARAADALFWLPSESEWYKAAYYKGGGTDAGYWNFATQSDNPPASEGPPGTDMINGSANYGEEAESQLTPVGWYDAKPSDSAYGTYDQNGNLWEWNEGVIYNTARNIRGGSFRTDQPWRLASAARIYEFPHQASDYIGFRIGSTDEWQTLNNAPVLDEILPDPVELYDVDDPLDIDVTADDLDLPNDVLAYEIRSVGGSDFPTGATITKDPTDERHAIFSWLPSDAGAQIGDEFQVEVVVTDLAGAFDTDVFTIQVVPEPSTVLMLVGASLLGLVMWWRRRS